MCSMMRPKIIKAVNPPPVEAPPPPPPAPEATARTAKTGEDRTEETERKGRTGLLLKRAGSAFGVSTGGATRGGLNI